MRVSIKGFSLAELLVAMFVIVVGISGVMASMYWGTQKSDHGQFVTQASNYGRAIMEQMVVGDTLRSSLQLAGTSLPGPNSGINDADGVQREILEFPFDVLKNKYGETRGASNQSLYRRNIKCRRLATPGATDATGAAYLGDMIHITTRIFWSEDSKQGENWGRSLKLEAIVEQADPNLAGGP